MKSKINDKTEKIPTAVCFCRPLFSYKEGIVMATTRIMPLHVGKGRTESRAISDIIDYVANPQKTDNGRLIAGFACDSRTADAEFLLAKRQ